MLNSYNDAHLMQESFVFYTSTNTFRNPAFGASALELDEDYEECCDQLIQYQQQQQPQKQRQEKPEKVRRQAPTAKQKVIDFCDNFAFALRAKAFVLETNFKRRLRGLRRFLDARLLPLVVAAGGRAHSHSATYGPSSSGCAESQASLRDLIRDEQQLQRGPRRPGPPRPSKFPARVGPPMSAKALGVQQERILSRLERIKRDSQRLFNMQHHATILESDHETSSEVVVMATPDNEEDEPPTGGSDSRVQVPIWLSSQKPAHDSSCKGPSASTAVDRSRWAASLAGSAKQVVAVATTPKKTCIVCYERAPNIVTLPCEHADICSDCFIEIIYMAVKNAQYPLRCVLCRQRVERIRCSRKLVLSVIKRNRRVPSSASSGAVCGNPKRKVVCRLPFELR